MAEFRNVRVDLLNEPPTPVRVLMDEHKLAELAADIRVRGLLLPLLVKAVPPTPANGFRPPEPFTFDEWEQAGGRYEVVAGHRRQLAAAMAGCMHVQVKAHGPGESCGLGEMLAENFHREDVTAAEEGWALAEYIDEYKPTEAQLIALTGQSAAWINERLDLVHCDAEVAQAVAERKISFAVARELLRVNPNTACLVLRCHVNEIPPEKCQEFVRHRAFLLDLCVRGGATARVARSYVEQWKAGLVPSLSMPYGVTSPDAEASPPPPPERCIVCGRDSDPQNFKRIAVHWWEKDVVVKALRGLGIEVYES
jgi:ParB/RepB/Spo0J family partition protein